MNVWSYVITTDRGSAPNYEGPSVTLAICKPRIRSKAQPGELVLGFNGSRLSRNPHSLRWAGIVSEVKLLEDYWEDPRFHAKRPDRSETPDNIYRLVNGRLSQEPNSSHDERNVATDVRGKNVLVFSRVWHFAKDGPELEEDFGLRVPLHARRIEPLNEIDSDLWAGLEAWLNHHDCGLPTAAKSRDKSCNPSRKRSVKCASARPSSC